MLSTKLVYLCLELQVCNQAMPVVCSSVRPDHRAGAAFIHSAQKKKEAKMELEEQLTLSLT